MTENESIKNIRKDYHLKNRHMYTPRELLLYAIEQCIFGDEK